MGRARSSVGLADAFQVKRVPQLFITIWRKQNLDQMLNKLSDVLIYFGLSLGFWQAQGQGVGPLRSSGPCCGFLYMVRPYLVWKMKGRSWGAGRLCWPMAPFVVLYQWSDAGLGVKNQVFSLKHHWSDSAATCPLNPQVPLLDRYWVIQGGYVEVMQSFLQETLRLVEQKSDFKAVPDQHHSGAVIPTWTLCSKVLGDCVHAGANCCLQFLHNFWDTQE